MRLGIAGIFLLLAGALVGCGIVARRSNKPMGIPVSLLLFALVPPVLGNLIITLSGDEPVSLIGCYTYYLGMDVMVMALLYFTSDYCGMGYRVSPVRHVVCALLALDVFQYALNPLFGHAFKVSPIMLDGYPYYTLVAGPGQAYHRIVCYGIFLAALVIFACKTATAPKIYVERYLVIFLSMVVGGIWQSYYIFSGAPVDRSMVAFAVFGLAIFYFSLYYRPRRLLDRLLARVVSDMPEAVLFFDDDGSCIYANDLAIEALGIRDDKGLTRCAEFLDSLMETDESFDSTLGWCYNADLDLGGGMHSWRFSYQPLYEESGRRAGSFLMMYDRTAEERRFRHENYLANHDQLTGIFNQTHLYTRSRQLIEQNPDVTFVVCAVDVRDFKLINDVFSREVGDQVLLNLAQRIEKFASERGVYGRLTGDRFGIVMPESEFEPELIEERLGRHEVLGSEYNYPIVVHMGVYRVEERDLPVSVMFDRAFMAIASIKNDYQRHVAFYDRGMREDVLWAQKLAGELPQAIAERQIRPYLHPMVDSFGEVVGAEVLCRWIHPTEGFLPPGRFIPVFERNGMIAQVDQYMWRCAAEILSDWKSRGIDLFLSVNISPKDFYFIDVASEIRSLVSEFGIEPSRLRLEITETVMMTDLEKRLSILDDLRASGFLVEMDDFGSGYSSLNLLKDMPVDVLKIDMMFLYKTKDQTKAKTILQNIINLSGDLGIPSLTEGVETADQRDMLLSMGCKFFQGYYFAKPMPLSEFEDFLAA